ncbi:DUF4406 domain-containing protein [Candidatus Nomurabacteria bacterium]|nr:DUF4406 domain-containing protein [Candidatus Nomurabacteria bacterium]
MSGMNTKVKERSIEDISKYAPIYISGKISGLSDLNEPAFQQAEDALASRGFLRSNVINPLKLHDQTVKGMSWEDYMWIDISTITSRRIAAMIVLYDWAQSRGAVLEVIMALSLGVPIFDMEFRNITGDVVNHLSGSPKWYLNMVMGNG